LRLGTRLVVTWDIDALPLDNVIPQLTLQPLLENAIYHGIEPLPDGGTIAIEGRATATAVELVIRNPVGGDISPPHGNRLAQDNVRQRLAAHFGDMGRLVIEATPHEYCVRVRLPRRAHG
jgi:two-component system sensor histidine kinase AlgZ